jgi:hypothetical protein
VNPTFKARAALAALLALVALGGCTTFSRLASYGSRMADAKVSVDGKAFSIWVHPADNDLLVQRALGAAMGQGFVSGLSLNSVNLMDPKPYWKRAAELITAPLGCTVTDIYTLDNRTSWEAPYACPPGVDLRAKVAEQRAALRAGAPIRP